MAIYHNPTLTVILTLILGQALNPARPVPARPTSLKTVPARPKIRPGQEDVKTEKPATADQRRPASAIT